MLLKRTMKYFLCISCFLMSLVPIAVQNNAPSYGENLALNKLTRQVATKVIGRSQAAVDGNFLTEQYINTVQKNASSWWTVDLEAVYNVRFIRLSLRNVKGLIGMQLRISDLDETITGFDEYQFKQTFSLNDIEQPFDKPIFALGKIKKSYSVVVRLVDSLRLRHLALISEDGIRMSEFEAYSHYTREVNFALSKGASVFSRNGALEDPANFLIDGNRFDGPENYPLEAQWWEIDLQSTYLIGFIVIRFTASDERLNLQVSSAVNPSHPTRRASNSWEEVYDYNLFGYPQVVREFFPPKKLRHIAQIEESKTRVLEVEAYAGYNLAYGKPTMQSNTVGSHRPELAVNAVMDDKTETRNTGEKWWRVDLAAEHMINKVEVVTPLLLNIASLKLRTSSMVEPGRLSADYDGWSNEQEFETNDNVVGVINLSEAFEVRHLAVVSTHLNQPVSIIQFVVYEYNYAQGGFVNISSPVDGYPPSNAVDGNYISHVRGQNAHSNWITVTLTKRIGFRAAILYQNFRQKEGVMRELTIDAVTLYTHKTNPANTNFNDLLSGWSKCFHKTAFAESLRMECLFNWKYPVTKSIGMDLRPITTLYIIREIVIYGHELPQFKVGATISVSSPTPSSVQIDFEKWNSVDSGSIPPTNYKIAIAPIGIVEYILHKTVLGKSTISKTVTGLTPDTSYTITLTCRVSGATCPGLPLTKQYSTSCGKPGVSLAVITRYKFTNKFGVVVHAQEVISECKQIVSYRVKLATAGNTRIYSKEFEQPTDANITGLTEGDNYTLTIEAKNDADLTTTTIKKFKAILPAPSGFCPPAPKFKTAELTRKHIRKKVVWKQKVRYVCKKKWKRKKGDYVLTCVTHSENTLSWQGEPLECEPLGAFEGSEVELVAYIMVGVAVIGIACAAGALLMRKKRRKRKKHEDKLLIEPAPFGDMEQKKARMSMSLAKRKPPHPSGYETIQQYDQSNFELAKQKLVQSNADVRRKKSKVPEEPYKSLKRHKSSSRK